MTFPHRARYRFVLQHVGAFLNEEAIAEFPIDPFEIIERNGWTLIPYSKLSEKTGKSLTVIEEAFGGDGYTKYKPSGYQIAYNDTVAVPERIRFTLMHEIGHIYLNHLLDFDETVLTRGRLTDAQYGVLEKEADCFARNTLAPACVVMALRMDSPNDLADTFRISFEAARFRLTSLRWDMDPALAVLLPRVSGFIHRVLNTRFCLECHHLFIDGESEFCPVCGEAQLINRKWGDEVIYDGIEMNEELYPLRCPKCDNEELNGDDNCFACGAEVMNRCTNVERDFHGNVEWECETILHGKARYCPKCGGESTYLKQKFLRPWHEVKREHDSEAESPDPIWDEILT